MKLPLSPTDGEVKAAYRALARDLHPDSPCGSKELFQALGEALEALQAPVPRKAVERARLNRDLINVNMKIATQEGIQKSWGKDDWRRGACMKPLLEEKARIEAALLAL